MHASESRRDGHRATEAAPADTSADALRSLVLRLAGGAQARPDTLLPLLHAVQDALGHVPDGVVAPIAETLGLSRAEVHGVITFYHFFRRQPPGRHQIQICYAESCQACGAEALLAEAGRLLGCTPGSTRADGAVTLEAVYCLGLCGASPALQIDGRLHARVEPARLAALLAGLPGERPR